VLAIFCIGGITFLVDEVATVFGCCVGLPNSITAITFVALGTSLPDTLASRTAALHDDYADDSVGNITGSNSVNVFLGIGLPWLIGSIYWTATTGAGMPVPACNLGFSVVVFLGVALLTVAHLIWRRSSLGYELGGKHKYASGLALVSLWLLYVLLCSLQAKGVISATISAGGC
jgi:solute carrier family 8 (sodium/calcium exchanger)